jgi:hypothetical protein
MNSNCIILSHFFIGHDRLHYWDNLSNSDKSDILDFSILDCKRRMPDVPIILSCHGDRPMIHSSADFVIWEDFIPSELGRGHPILVKKALEKAKSLGFANILKMRADSICDLDDPFDFCQNILDKEETKCLVTAQTIPNIQIGDLFMYGNIDFLLSIWKPELWNYSHNGMINLYNIFEGDFYKSFSYRDVETLKWRFLSPSWKQHNGNVSSSENWDRYYSAPTNEKAYYENNITQS